MAAALNQVAQETVTVTGVPATLTMPPVLDQYGSQQMLDGAVYRYTPRHAIIRNLSAQPLRWRADGSAASAISGTLLDANGELSLMDPKADYYGILGRMSWVRDVAATANGDIEITYFG